ncbi:MAG: glycosyltransferase family 2 protein [Bacteroidales bacterium]|nr:glycosyltransferase family 2 protein [Bacteroidales bacterium]
MEVSVVIVSYRVKKFLRLCLESVLIAGHGTETEIIVVDNSGGDGTSEMLIRHYPEVKLIVNDSNRGFAAACNQGIRASSGRYVLVLNPDTVIPRETIRECVDFLDKNPDCGAAGVRLVDGDGRFLPESKRGIPLPFAALCRFTQLYRLFPRSSVMNRYYMGNIGENETAVVDAVTGAFLFCRSEALVKAGLFDERYFMFGEDIDLCMQIAAEGYRVWYCPFITVTHFKGRSGAMWSYRGLHNFYHSMHLFIEKNFTGRYIFPARALMHAGIFTVSLLSFIVRTPSILIRRMIRRPSGSGS